MEEEVVKRKTKDEGDGAVGMKTRRRERRRKLVV
jgi:hypothetical protein